jgi:branched-chain amino acid aminotransferase
MWFYVDGAFLEDEDAKISVLDRSFVYGDGCFEGIGCCEGRLLHLDDHLARLARSARMLRIELTQSPEELRELVLETALRNGMADAEDGYLRLILSRGSGPLGVVHTLHMGPPSLVVIPQIGSRRISYRGPMELLTAAITGYTRGGPLTLDARVKSNNYLPNVLAYLEAHDRGADMAILRDPQGYISEGHGMNVFAVRDGRLLTSPESASLAGVTRAHVIEVARGLGIACTETTLTAYDLYCADELFVTSSLESVTALASIDGIPLPEPLPGPISSALRDAYIRAALASGVPVPTRGGAVPGAY